MKVKLGAGILMTLIIAVVAAGCGGGSSSTTAESTAPPKPLAKATFIKKGNGFCLQAEKMRGQAIEAAAKRLPPGSKVTEAEQEVVVETALAPYKKMIRQFEELGAPKGESRKVEAITRALKSAVSSVQDDPGAAISSNSQFEEFNRLAAKYGLDACQV